MLRFFKQKLKSPLVKPLNKKSYKFNPYAFWGVFLLILSMLLAWLFIWQIQPAKSDYAQAQILTVELPKEPLLPKSPTRQEVVAYIKFQSLAQGVDPELMLCLAYAESGYNYLAKNKNSTASGIYQFISSTWLSTRQQMGLDISMPFNAKDNIDTAIWKVKNGGIHAWDLDNQCF